jgi:PHD/YefM family antitoxin component YafN of YafNO toxin-antitoxin module
MLNVMRNTVHTFHSSELNRNPVTVFTAAEQAPVLVTRRDGENLILMSSKEAEAAQRLQHYAAQLMGLVGETRQERVEEMTRLYPWMLALSPHDQERCAADLMTATRAALATGQPQILMAEVLSWQETAAAISENLTLEPSSWSDALEPVTRP